MPWSRSVCHGGVFWGATRAGDLEASLDHLRAQPFVDADRLAVIGWSHGGWTVLDLLATAPAAGLRGLRAAVAFYPYCGVASAAARRGWTQPVPLLVLLAGADDVTPPGPCRALAERQRARHTPVTVQLYPGARHAFDYDIPPRAAAWVRRELGFELVHDPAAAADARARVRAFLGERLRAVPAGPGA
jgi:dienelactone hydrolase